MAAAAKSDRKPHHITNIRYPYAKTWDKRNTSIEFELANVHFSTSNAIRRIMLSEVKTVGFRSEPYESSQVDIKVNDSPLHNQFAAHRIAMIPINVPNPDKFDVDDFVFIIDVVNNTNASRSISTEDFQVRQVSTNKMLPRDEVKRFFPPDPITGDYVLINKLHAKYFIPSKTLSQEVIADMAKSLDRPVDEAVRFYMEAKASISNAAENGHYCPVACASYINTVDPQRAKEGLRVYIDKHNEDMKAQNLTPMTLEALTRRFELTERARFYYINDKNDPNVFTFKIESLGVIPPLVVFHRSITILIDKLNTFVSNLVSRNENIITITPSNQMNGGYEMRIVDEDDTLGNIVQSHLCMLYADYTLPKEQRKLNFIGYKKPHPLENHIILAIQGKTENLDELIKEIIKPGCSEIVKMLSKIQNELEGTIQFINELKTIQ